MLVMCSCYTVLDHAITQFPATQGIIANKTLGYFIGRTYLFLKRVGLTPEVGLRISVALGSPKSTSYSHVAGFTEYFLSCISNLSRVCPPTCRTREGACEARQQC